MMHILEKSGMDFAVSNPATRLFCLDLTAMNKFSVLVAEDDRKLREEIADSVSDEGHIPISVSTGRDAIIATETHIIHATVLDMLMPDMAGVELVRMVRHVRRDIPCIMMGEDESREVQMEAFEAGACSFISKPFQLSVLRDNLKYVLAKWYGVTWPGESGKDPA
jgi:DNA-binding response OmpR family regulator